MRIVVREALLADSALQALGFTEGHSILSGDLDSPEARPFLNLKWGETLRAPFGGVVRQTVLAIWVHDQPNDYDRIDLICARLRILVPSLLAMTDVSDYVSQIAWTGDGPDLKDEGHRTIVRVSNYLLNVS